MHILLVFLNTFIRIQNVYLNNSFDFLCHVDNFPKYLSIKTVCLIKLKFLFVAQKKNVPYNVTVNLIIK